MNHDVPTVREASSPTTYAIPAPMSAAASAPLFTLPRAALEVARFVSEDTSRLALHHVCVHAGGPNVGVIVATNGHYLARMHFAGEVPAERYLIPAEVLLDAAKAKQPLGIDVYADKVEVRFEGDRSVRYNACVTRDRTHYTFPQYEQIIPSATAYEGESSTASEPVGLDFDYVADIAACLANLRKIAGRGAGRLALVTSVRFTAVEPYFNPAYFSASSTLAKAAGLISADFILMPCRL